MPSVFKGSISFGLVNVPVKLFTASDKQSVSFRTLHKACKTPVNQKRWCVECGKEVEYADTVKGYEISKGDFVEITDEDLKQIDLKSSKYIQIIDFIHLSEIDPVYFDKPYFLAPEGSGEKAYVLLHKAMVKTGTAAVARITMREKEHMCIIRVYGASLMLSTMLFDTEIRAPEADVEKLEKKSEVSESELELACRIVENLTGAFEPSKYTDRYYDELMKVIEAKAEGREPDLKQESTKADSAKALDLFEKLKMSVEATRAKEKAGERPEAKTEEKTKKAVKPKTDKMPPNKPPEKTGRSSSASV